jgi:hypothetical protein
MAQLTIENLIKILIGVFVVVAVVIGLYFFMKDYVIDFFQNLFGEEVSEIFLSLIK